MADALENQSEDKGAEPANSSSAQDNLRDQYIALMGELSSDNLESKQSSKSPSGSAGDKNGDTNKVPAGDLNSPAAGASNGNAGDAASPQVVLRPNEQRMAEERMMFRSRYNANNIEVTELQEGWGPFQALAKLVQDGKLNLSKEEMLSESRRIRDRDFKEWGRDFYNKTDHVKLWSEQEIEDRVDSAVKRKKGIDVSAHQGDIDWKKVKEAGYEFAFLKATEGGDWVDSKFEQNRKGALDAGLTVGYYHYFRPPRPVEDQIQNFVKTVGKVDANALRLVIDTEDEKLWKPYTIEQRIKMIDDWCKGVQKELGVTPQITIYGSPNFFNEVLKNSPELAKYSLWIANYNVPEPIIPKPWTKWDFWQYSEKGKVPGINSTEVDLNMFHGDDLSKTPVEVRSRQHKHHR